jgi:hypothetical protein
MNHRPLFGGLIIDENDQSVEVNYVGGEPFYVVNDAGFRRHIPSADVDRQVLNIMIEQVQGNEDVLSEQTAQMLGQDDIFTRAMIQNQLKQIQQQVDKILETGIPEEGRAYMGMMGFRVVINRHGEVLRVIQPGRESDEDGE